MNINRQLDSVIKRSHEEQQPKERHLFPCSIFAVDCRRKLLYLQSLEHGDLLQLPQLIPHQDVFRIPTPDRNWVYLLTDGPNHGAGIPILMDRSFIEPNIFETADPAGEQG